MGRFQQASEVPVFDSITHFFIDQDMLYVFPLGLVLLHSFLLLTLDFPTSTSKALALQ